MTMEFEQARAYLFGMHYRWARSFLLAEIKDDFPNLRCVQNHDSSDYIKFMSHLAPAERERYGLAIQKCSYRGLLEGTADEINERDMRCITEYEQFASNSRTL